MQLAGIDKLKKGIRIYQNADALIASDFGQLPTINAAKPHLSVE